MLDHDRDLRPRADGGNQLASRSAVRVLFPVIKAGGFVVGKLSRLGTPTETAAASSGSIDFREDCPTSSSMSVKVTSNPIVAWENAE